jgi:SAM-dependent methyltransferase
LSMRSTFILAICDSVQSRAFDRILGVSTRGLVVTKSSTFARGGDNCPYAGCQWWTVRRALKKLAPMPTDMFVDLGSGKGKALLIAGRLPYRRVLGVEIDEELCQSAKRNIKRARPKLRAHEVDSVSASVLGWPIPDETSVVFMYNPFTGYTFQAAIDKIFESYDRRPRDLHIVYQFPWEHNRLLATGRVVVASVQPSIWPARLRWWQSGDVIVSYRVCGTSSDSKSVSARPLIMRHPAMRRWSGPNNHRFTMSAPGHQTLYSRAG